MAGHSKWANIRARKGAQDAKRGKLFTKLIREITVAVKQGGGPDPAYNPSLRSAMDKAFSNNMKRDTIDNTIKKASGAFDGVHYDEVRYEGYAPGGVAVLVDCLTDNRNRTVGEVRHAFTKAGGNLGTDGSVAYLFQKVGILSFAAGQNEERLMEAAIEAGADDVVMHSDGSLEVLTSPENFLPVKQSLIDAGMAPSTAEITMRAETHVELDAQDAEKMIRLQEHLEDLDDVQNVYSNAEISEEILDGIS
ncbi:MAG: YebC/PmpR family DNA-binding transcriptional regulator [Methylococcaceae bacterium]|nr:YebC/PmpR family DNA-binding transcriptional regulator [Methylococcaceae bacterium]MCI0668479.1 YebC/PmpR family DNA-binding transcriptional regulator [Methylococcaceae bacterium]MCI0732652.1 YebC/PmpR family DNA-binding transcriptional regulator [Methylococcaceae bacterium]